MTQPEYWAGGRPHRAAVRFEATTDQWGEPLVTVWAGDELDPTWLTPEDARRAAAEWPAILLRLADQAEKHPDA